jgi:hypothetical protein
MEESNCHSKKLKSGHLSQKGSDTNMNWLTDHRSQHNLILNFNLRTAPRGVGLDSNISTLALRVIKVNDSGDPEPGGINAHPVPGGYMALQVAGVSNETVKYGLEFCGTRTP